MSWVIILIIALPLLFVIGMVYNALKEQRRLEKTLLPEIIAQRRAEREKQQAELRRIGRESAAASSSSVSVSETADQQSTREGRCSQASQKR